MMEYYLVIKDGFETFIGKWMHLGNRMVGEIY